LVMIDVDPLTTGTGANTRYERLRVLISTQFPISNMKLSGILGIAALANIVQASPVVESRSIEVC
jgi:hypothetical protein